VSRWERREERTDGSVGGVGAISIGKKGKTRDRGPRFQGRGVKVNSGEKQLRRLVARK